jgi:hypothetical protein
MARTTSATAAHKNPVINRVPSRSGDQLNLNMTVAELARAKTVSKAIADAIEPLGLSPAALVHIARQLADSKTFGRYKARELVFNLGGFHPPGTVDVGIRGTGTSLPFSAETGDAIGLIDVPKK